MLKSLLMNTILSGAMLGVVMQPALSFPLIARIKGENVAHVSASAVPLNASAKYNLNFINSSRETIDLVRGLKDCMHNPGPESFSIAPSAYNGFEVEDSNELFQDCTNATKDINWKVYLNGSNSQVNIITFTHQKYGNSWYTKITDMRGAIKATCGGYNCANVQGFGVLSGGAIEITLLDQ